MFRFLVKLIKLFKSSLFLAILVVCLGIAVFQMSLKLVNLTAQVATLSASAAMTSVKHKKQMAKLVSRERAKARLKRVIVAIPFLGMGASAAFEASDLNIWLRENPDKDAGDYGCEVTSSSAEVFDDVLNELPQIFRPSKSKIMGKMAVCQ